MMKITRACIEFCNTYIYISNQQKNHHKVFQYKALYSNKSNLLQYLITILSVNNSLYIHTLIQYHCFIFLYICHCVWGGSINTYLWGGKFSVPWIQSTVYLTLLNYQQLEQLLILFVYTFVLSLVFLSNLVYTLHMHPFY